MSTGGPDLFVICKSCGSEVSPYITECPYCGSRLRKRAPKLDREGHVFEKRRRRRPSAPSLSRLKRGEIPGIRAETRPYGTLLLLVLSFAGCLLWRAAAVGSETAIKLWGVNGTHLWWRLLVAPFTYANTAYAFVTLAAIAIFGWLLERRHGPFAVLVLFAVGAIGGTGATIAANPGTIWLGANGAALAMIAAWSIPDLLAVRAGEEIEGDLLGAAAFAIAVALMPLATLEASWLSDAVGVLGGVLLGLPLARMQRVR